jgi:hypothetical protein
MSSASGFFGARWYEGVEINPGRKKVILFRFRLDIALPKNQLVYNRTSLPNYFTLSSLCTPGQQEKTFKKSKMPVHDIFRGGKFLQP